MSRTHSMCCCSMGVSCVSPICCVNIITIHHGFHSQTIRELLQEQALFMLLQIPSMQLQCGQYRHDFFFSKIAQSWPTMVQFRMSWINSIPLILFIYHSLPQRCTQFSAYFMAISFIRDTINNGTTPNSPGCGLVGRPLSAFKLTGRAHITAAFGRLPSR